MNHNKITDISFLSGFENLYELFMPYNDVSSFKGLETSKDLVYLIAYGNNLSGASVGSDSSGVDCLQSLEVMENLYYLDLSLNTHLVHTGCLKRL